MNALFRAARAELGLSLGNGFISRCVFSIPKHGMVNVHCELLPEYRNAQSVLWAIHDGSRTTGFTLHQVDDGIDTGPILVRREMPIELRCSLRDTIVHTCAAVTREAAESLVQLVAGYADVGAHAVAQTGGRSRTTPTARRFLQIWLQHRRLFHAAQR